MMIPLDKINLAFNDFLANPHKYSEFLEFMSAAKSSNLTDKIYQYYIELLKQTAAYMMNVNNDDIKTLPQQEIPLNRIPKSTKDFVFDGRCKATITQFFIYYASGKLNQFISDLSTLEGFHKVHYLQHTLLSADGFIELEFRKPGSYLSHVVGIIIDRNVVIVMDVNRGLAVMPRQHFATWLMRQTVPHTIGNRKWTYLRKNFSEILLHQYKKTNNALHYGIPTQQQRNSTQSKSKSVESDEIINQQPHNIAKQTMPSLTLRARL